MFLDHNQAARDLCFLDHNRASRDRCEFGSQSSGA